MTKVRNAPVRSINATCPTTDTYCHWTCTTCTRNDTDIIRCPNRLDWALTSQTSEVVIAELMHTSAAIKNATGFTPKYMRPPFGDYDDRIRDIATQLGMKPTLWDLDTNDWMSAEDATFNINWITANFTQWVNDPNLKTTGHISLEHDLYNQTSAQIPLVVPILKKANYTIKPVYQCLNDPSPYVESLVTPTPAATTAPPPRAATPTDNPIKSTPTRNSEAPSQTQKSGATKILNNDLLSLSFVVVVLFGSLFY
ncbi:18835_t:CDS:2 [Racocetra fulgida]|uniref:18835_t:CDS:1 n=1 Tax=Racocetra fulgida TaxID=60492 RepID=A0A9N8YX88_9GLOM|nr:18835_t:CDS:2 [Racocetra fulgida]